MGSRQELLCVAEESQVQGHGRHGGVLHRAQGLGAQPRAVPAPEEPLQ
jgi:hypothetical protein